MSVTKFMLFGYGAIAIFATASMIGLIYFGCKIAAKYEKEEKDKREEELRIKRKTLEALEKIAKQTEQKKT